MGQKHLITTVTFMTIGAKIMKQSKQVLNKLQLQTTKKAEGRAKIFFGFNTQN